MDDRTLRSKLLLALTAATACSSASPAAVAPADATSAPPAREIPAARPAPANAGPYGGDIDSIMVSPDGRHALTIHGSGERRLWTHLDGSREPIALPATNVEAAAIAGTPDGTIRMATVAGDGLTIQEIDAEGYERSRAVVSPLDPAVDVSVLPGGDRVLALFEDRSVRLLDADARELARIEERGFSPDAMAVSRDGTTAALLVGGKGHGSRAPLQLHTMDIDPDGLGHDRAPVEIRGVRGLDQVALSADGRSAAVAAMNADGRVLLYVVSTVDRVQTHVVPVPFPGDFFGFSETGEGSCSVEAPPPPPDGAALDPVGEVVIVDDEAMGFDDPMGEPMDEALDAEFFQTTGGLRFADADTVTFDDDIEGLRWQLDLRTGRLREVAERGSSFASAGADDLELSADSRWLRVQPSGERPFYLGYESFSPMLTAVAPSGEAILWASGDGEAWIDRSHRGGGLQRVPVDFELGIGQIAWLDETRAVVLDYSGAVTFSVADGRVLDEIELGGREPARYDPQWRAMVLPSYHGKALIEIDDVGRFGPPVAVPDPAPRWGFLPRTGDDAPAIWTLGDVRRLGPVPIEAQHPDAASLHVYTLPEVRAGTADRSHPELARLDAVTELAFGPAGQRLVLGADGIEITTGAGKRTLPVTARHVEHTGDDLLVQVVDVPRDLLLTVGDFGGIDTSAKALGFLTSELESDTLTVYDAESLRPRWSVDVGVPIVQVGHDLATSIVAITTEGGGVLVIDGETGAARIRRCGLSFARHNRPPPDPIDDMGLGSVCQ